MITKRRINQFILLFYGKVKALSFFIENKMSFIITDRSLLPREKLIQLGAKALSDSELLAIFLRTGIRGTSVFEFSQKLIHEFGSLSCLMNATLEDFCAVKGLGVAKYTQLQACVELTSRYLAHQLVNHQLITSTELAKNYLSAALINQEREIFLVMFLNTQHNVICSKELFFGTYNCVDVYPREIVKLALKYNASALILAHNHPSGYSEPSEADKVMTDKIIEACQLVDLKVLDHFVIGRGQMVSFLERGWL